MSGMEERSMSEREREQSSQEMVFAAVMVAPDNYTGPTQLVTGTSSATQGAQRSAGIQERVNQKKHKTGICILCACTNAWCAEEQIEPSDAVERMRECFEDKLGYLVIQIGTTITSQHLDEALQELSEVQLPLSYCRIFFHYFGHGTEDSLCLADKDVERKHIIGRLQSICPSHPVDLFKIFLFDSCRTTSPLTTQPIPVSKQGRTGELSGYDRQVWKMKCTYPSSNTLVINATDFNSKAYYINDRQVHGCGLVTLYFTELAPKMNASLGDVLIEVRKKVDAYVESNVQQNRVLVCEDRLMGSVNLLAESTGKARVTPTVATVNVQTLSANVQWIFGCKVEDRIIKFIVKVIPDGDGEGVGVLESVADRKDRFATFSCLKPNSTYHVKVIAEYKDDVQAESEHFTLTTLDRSSPQSIKLKFTPQYPASQEATVEWSFPGDVFDLSRYVVKAVSDGEQNPEVIVHDVQVKKAILKPLSLSSKYTVTVTAVYRDGIEMKGSEEFFSGYGLRAATNISATVIGLRPLKVEVKWSYHGIENAVLPTGFMVVAKDGNSSNQKDEMVEDPRIHLATLELSHNTTYSLKVMTIYGQNTNKESEEIQFKTPSEDEVKPTRERIENIKSNSVVVAFSDPPFVQKAENGDHIKLAGYSVDHHECQRDKPELIVMPYERHNYSTSNTSCTQPRRQKLAGLVPGKRYKLVVRAHYSIGEPIHSEEREFTTKPSVLQKICLSASVLVPLLLCFLLISSYVPYRYHLQGSGDCETNYILSNATIQCGHGNSLKYDGAEIKGCPVFSDLMAGSLNVWQIREDELKLYSQPLQPVYSDGHTSYHSTILLTGWSNYTWKNSVIAGSCCITNNNEEERTASLHIFRQEKDAFTFQNREGVKNAILSEQISVQPHNTCCFTKWGSDSPFTVTHSSYHFIGIDLPANISYTANITLMQAYVNVSDYPNSKPKQFSRDNHTHFTHPDTGLHQIDYLYICQAPPVMQKHDAQSNVYLTLHVCTCNDPHHWMRPTFTSLAVLGGFGALYILSALVCYCLYIKRQILCLNHCPCSNRTHRNGYDPINN